MRHCKSCKDKFEPKRFLDKYCPKEECQEIAIKEAIEKVRKNKEKKWRKEKKEMKIYTHSKEYKKQLQKEINKLSKMIDKHFNFGCIDCGKPFGRQVDASHFSNVGGNENIRYNLHNIHASRSYCNQWGRGRKLEYYDGLIKRYGKDYADYVKFEIGKKYKRISLSELEVVEKLKIVRKLIKDFDTFNLDNGIQARNMFNKVIGIYHEI